MKNIMRGTASIILEKLKKEGRIEIISASEVALAERRLSDRLGAIRRESEVKERNSKTCATNVELASFKW